jgi:hypothetical protein
VRAATGRTRRLPRARVGHHLLAAGETAAAVPHVLRAAETGAAVGAYRDALALVDSVRHVATGADGARALALRADLLAAIGDGAAPAAYREAIAASAPERRRLLQARLARILAYGGDLDAARALLSGLEPDGSPADRTIMLARAALLYFTGDLDAAREVSDRVRPLIVESDADRQVLDLVALQGLVAHNRGEWYQQLRAELRRVRNDPALASAVFDSHLCVAEYLLYGPTPYPEVIELAGALRDTAGRAGAMRAVAFAGIGEHEVEAAEPAQPEPADEALRGRGVVKVDCGDRVRAVPRAHARLECATDRPYLGSSRSELLSVREGNHGGFVTDQAHQG